MSHDLTYSLNNKGQTDIVLLDFSKAFDKVSHHLLLTKSQHYGIRGNVLNWISVFLLLRTQPVCGGSSSELIDVTSGVPQGSVLGPLLFLAYINDISNNLSSSCHLFADDCILYWDIKSDEDAQILQEDLNKHATWAKTWGKQFNIDKCQVLRVTLRHDPCITDYFLQNQKLKTTTWNLKQCNRKVKLDAYKIYVEPILNYAVTVWSPRTTRGMNKPESVQKRAAHFIVKDYRRTSSITQILIFLSLESISYLHTKMWLLMFYKIVHKLVEPSPYLITYILTSDVLAMIANQYYISIIFPMNSVSDRLSTWTLGT